MSDATSSMIEARSGPALRVLSPSGVMAAARFEGSPLVASGLVNLIALDLVAERLGDRWPAKREQVYAQVEQVLERRLGPTGFYQRVSETDFLIAQPDRGPFGAQSLCLRCLGEVLTYFFGRAEHQDLVVHRVTQLSSGAIEAVPVDSAAAASGEAQEIKALAATASGSGQSLLSPSRWSPFVAQNGRTVRVSCRLEPVFELKTYSRIGYRLRRRVLDTRTGEPLPPQELIALSRSDLLRMDMATIARGLARVGSTPEEEQQLSLIIPVSHVSLSNPAGRSLLSQAFAEARQAVLQGVICEVCDIEDVPQVALVGSVALIQASCLFVIGNLDVGKPEALRAMKDTGLRAVSFDCPPNVGDAELIGWLRSMMRASQKVTKSTMIYRCPSQRHMALASLMGATHASLAPSDGADGSRP